MGRLAVILGSSTAGPGGVEVTAAIERRGGIALQRHGAAGAYVLPHAIDHETNLRSLLEADCDRVLAIGSVGSLASWIRVGSFVCPHDFIALQVTATTFTDARGHAMPGFDSEWRSEVLAAWRQSETGEARDPRSLRDGGVYWQTNGPRFETPAEIGLIAAHAHLVGMTLASECIVAAELGLRYAAVCVVDNLANGVAAQPLSAAEIEGQRRTNVAHLRDALDAVLPNLIR